MCNLLMSLIDHYECLWKLFYSYILLPFGLNKLQNQLAQFKSALVLEICLFYLVNICVTGDANYSYILVYVGYCMMKSLDLS